jgi:hypothetical protein
MAITASLFGAGTRSSGSTSTSGSWPKRLVAASGFLTTPILAPGTSSAYGVVAAHSDEAVFGRLDSINLASGQLSRGPLVFVDAQVVLIGDAVGLLEQSVVSVSPNGTTTNPPIAAYETLHLVRSGTTTLHVGVYLRALGRTTTPVLAAGQGSPVGGLWVDAGKRLVLFDPGTAAIFRSLPVPPGILDSFLPDPSGRDLCVAATLESKKTEPFVVYRVEAASRRILARRELSFVVGGEVTAATAAGVWVAVRYGMSGTAMLLDGPQLTTTKPPTPEPVADSLPSPGADISTGFSTTIVGGVAWLVGSTGVACVPPSTAAVHSQAPFRRAANGNW